MAQNEITRSETSKAVLTLRRALGMTQTIFAVEVAKVAISTIARWETSDPPTGETLLRLEGIARERAHNRPHTEALLEVADIFRKLFIEEALQLLGYERPTLLMLPDGSSYLLCHFTDANKTKAAHKFLSSLGGRK